MKARVIKPFAALMLALVLICTSVTMAVARGQAEGGMVVTLCSPEGAQTLVVDAQGNPVPATHICPYCIIGAAVLPDEGPMVPGVLRRAIPLDPVPLQSTPRPHRPDGLPEARAPPLSV